MKRSAKRLAAVLAALLLFAALPLTACSGGTTDSGVVIPAGMRDATGEEGGYCLFLPEDWSFDRSTGVMIATPSLYTSTTLSFTVFPTDRSVEEYWLESRDAIGAKFKNYVLTEEGGETLVAGQGARRYIFSGTYYTGVPYTVRLHLVKKNGRMFVFNYTAKSAEGANEYETYLTRADAVIDNFLFTDEPAGAPAGTWGEVTDGWRELADPAIHAYSFTVPESWVPDMRNGFVSACVSDEDRTSVSLTCHYPGAGVTTLLEYFDALQPSYRAMLGNYTVTHYATAEDEAPRVGGIDGVRFEFEGDLNGVPYRFLQIFAVRGSTVYTFTYAASTALFDTHRADADAILARITFR